MAEGFAYSINFLSLNYLGKLQATEEILKAHNLYGKQC